jgi:CubicO group peptidase (beta-lactamase class C family)/D-alanyl-D-alanine dipeptidase
MLPRIALLIACACAPVSAAAQPRTAPASKYTAAVKAIEEFIDREMADKKLPALSIALVDDQSIVWARGFGFADRERKKPASADTVYRIGGVSKVFTAIAVMQLVEQGKVDLDAPITDYLRDFRPKNLFGTPITLRMLLSHRSGLACEAPQGSLFDDRAPALAGVVDSLNMTTLAYQPGSTIKYSNAAVAVAGYAVEKAVQKPFEAYVDEKLLGPLGLKKSGFKLAPALSADLAEATMWTYHGREFPAPTFPLGAGPSVAMYSNVNDLGRFMSVLFADGKGLLKPESLKQMQAQQFAKKGDKRGYGIGFSIDELDGQPLVGHGGAVYGFAADLSFLPNEKLGVVVMTSRELANAVIRRIAQTALRQMLAVKHGAPAPKMTMPAPLTPAEAKALAGRYQNKDASFDLVESAGRLWLYPGQGGIRSELRKLGERLVADDVLDTKTVLERRGDALAIGAAEFKRVETKKPASCPPQYLGLIGEYGPEHNVLFVFEKDGKLHCNVEWFFVYPLREIKPNVYALPERGLYIGEQLVFTRDGTGHATECKVGPVVFKRRHLDGEDGQTFRIKPLKPIAELRKEALAATPPPEKKEFRPSELIDVTRLDATIKLDLRYASDNNFMGTPLYPPIAKAYMQKPAAEALAKVNARLKAKGYGLLIHDSYRPWSVTKMFFEGTPVHLRNFVADPATGSRHNRGCAVDLTLYDLASGKPIEMVSGFDEFSDRAFPDYLGGTSLQRWHRELLRQTMESEDFTVWVEEWWHFDFKDWKHYAIGNQTFEELQKK